MKRIIRWAISNSPAMNTFMIGALILGTVSMAMLRREVFPEFELEILLVQVPYPQASPDEVEEAICQKIEEAVRPIAGIKKQTSVATEGMGSIILELETGVNAQKILNEVRSEVDRISSKFPQDAEDHEVKQITLRQPAIHVGVIGPDDDSPSAQWNLRHITERVRDDLIRLNAVSQAELVGARPYQIDVEIDEDTLRRYDLTLQIVAQKIREWNLEKAGGALKTTSQEILIRVKNKGLTGDEIAKVPIKKLNNKIVLTVGDLGTVRDGFVDDYAKSLVDGKPAQVISVSRTSQEDLLDITDAVRDYIETKKMPRGYSLVVWGDRSVEVRDRMDLLGRNALAGLVLVLLVLAVFLNLRLAWWVALGIPVSILGAAAVLLATGNTLNMLTMFAFLMALGIVVDDAIVIGENIFTHRQRGAGPIRAAVDGTLEVLPSVATSVSTTIIAFMPLFFVSGVMGKFIAVLPLAMIAMLVISLVESTFILPCHLAHVSKGHRTRPRAAAGLWGMLKTVLAFFAYPFKRFADMFGHINRKANRFIDWAAEKMYLPALRYSLKNPAVAIAGAVAMLMLTIAVIKGGKVPFIIFPKMDSNTIEAIVTFPDGTHGDRTDEATIRIENAMKEMHAKYAKEGKPILNLTRRSVGFITTQGAPGQAIEASGSHVGLVTAELVDVSQRSISSFQIIREWRKMVGDLPGVDSINYKSSMTGPGGTPIEFKLLARSEDFGLLEKAVERAKAELAKKRGVFDITDDSRPGKLEYQLAMTGSGRTMDVSLANVADTVRATYYGEEVMRLQRGRHEIKLMVRYPRNARTSREDFKDILVPTGDGGKRPLKELVEIKEGKGYSEINRINQLRSIKISADVDESLGNAREIVMDMQKNFIPKLLKEYDGKISVRWEGQQEQTQESVQSMMRGFIIAVVAMFVLLTLEFRSYFQPLLILGIIPFGLVGAVGGHFVLGLPLTIFSLFGFVALTGVVVNDSIVLVDFINHRVRSGTPLYEALLDAGRRRLRPVMLTSVTTIAGLLPLLMETSFQARFLIPMAVSISFGLMATTFLVLFMVPTFYSLYGRMFLHEKNREPVPEALPVANGALRKKEMSPLVTRMAMYLPAENGAKPAPAALEQTDAIQVKP